MNLYIHIDINAYAYKIFKRKSTFMTLKQIHMESMKSFLKVRI